MGRAPCCDKANVKKGPWSPEEDAKLKSYIQKSGTGGNWIALPQKIGLKRCGKSCRLRWLNYLRPNIKHGGFSEEEENIICSLYCSIGSRWSVIAAQLPGRTDNDIKNYWNTKLKKKLLQSKQRRDQKPSCLIKQQHTKRECDTTISTDDVTFYQPMTTLPSLIGPPEDYYYLQDTLISSNILHPSDQISSDNVGNIPALMLPNSNLINYSGFSAKGFPYNNFGPEFQEEMGYYNNLCKWDGRLSENIRAFPQFTSFEDMNSQVVCCPTFSDNKICQNAVIQLPDCTPQVEARTFGMQQQQQQPYSVVN